MHMSPRRVYVRRIRISIQINLQVLHAYDKSNLDLCRCQGIASLVRIALIFPGPSDDRDEVKVS